MSDTVLYAVIITSWTHNSDAIYQKQYCIWTCINSVFLLLVGHQRSGAKYKKTVLHAVIITS